MFKIVFSPEVVQVVQTYIVRYMSYYEDLYGDSDIWWEEQIIEGYRAEATSRYDEIFSIIESSLEWEIVSYVKNETIIRWRTKVLLASFSDEDDIRSITHLEIR